MFVARFSIVFCFLSIAVSVFASSYSNRNMNDLTKKIAERRQKATSIDVKYALSAADGWLNVARLEYSDHESVSLTDIAWQQTNDILKLIDDNKLPLKTVETANGNLRVKDELWAFADETKKNTRYNSVVDDVAHLEVLLAWAGLKTWESGWKSATSIVDDAQDKADNIKRTLAAPEKPVVQPVIQPVVQPVVQQVQPSAINTRQPVALVVPADITFELTGRNGTPAFPSSALIVGDNADKFTISNDAPAKFALGTTVVTWKAVDHNGKTLKATQKVTVVDTTPPTIVIPSDINVELTSPDGMEINPGTAMVIDVGDPSPKLSNNAPKLFMPGTTIITWTAKDNAGNIATAGQKITIADTIPPVIKSPEDITVEANDPTGTIINIGPAKATDNLDPMPAITTDAPEKFPVGVTTVHWTATDKSGNKSSVSQKVTVTDTTKPVIIAPDDIMTDAVNTNDQELNIGTAKVHDNADGSPVVSNDAPAVFPMGETMVTWTVKDASGNVNTAKQKVSILDKKPPVITAPSDITTEATSQNGTVIDLGKPVVSDNIDRQVIVKNDAPASFKPGIFIITWTATDKAGNQARAIQKVVITDITPPRLLPPPDITIDAASASKMKINIGSPEVTDNADNSPKVANDAPLEFPLGTTTVTWLAIDSSGNRSMATQRVKIIDKTSPLIAAPKDITTNEASAKGTKVALGKPSVHDNIDQNPKIINNAPLLFNVGTTEVIWMAIDSSGNSAIAVQKVNIIKAGQKIVLPDKPKQLHVQPANQGDTQSVFLPYSVHFTPNGVSLSAKSKSVLNLMVSTLKYNPDINIMIVGCADPSGSLEKNIKIATSRAYVVADYLKKNGISADRMLIDSKIIQAEESAIAAAKARQTRFFYNSPASIKIKVVDQTADVVFVENTEVKKPVTKKSVIKKTVKPAVKRTVHHINKIAPAIKKIEKKTPVNTTKKPNTSMKKHINKKTNKGFA